MMLKNVQKIIKNYFNCVIIMFFSISISYSEQQNINDNELADYNFDNLDDLDNFNFDIGQI